MSYLIDKLALRAGNEKGEDEADTVGCCSLRCEHVTLEPPNSVVFDFLGKDSIRFYKIVEVDPQVFKNIRIFKENKSDSDALFDRVTVGLTLMIPLSSSLMFYNLDHHFKQTSSSEHEGPYRKGLPYLQRVHYFPTTA